MKSRTRRCVAAVLPAALLAVGLCAVARAQAPAGQAPSVQEIIEKANRVAYYQGKDGRAKVSMTITDDQGRTRKRKFTILRRDDAPAGGAAEADDDSYCGNQKVYVYFRLPADVNKMVFVVHKKVDSDDDRWLYLPDLDLVKRVVATEKRTSFVGSHFFYEDVSGRNISDDNHELVETTENYYVLKNTPKDAAAVEFSYFKMWIHRGTFVTTKVEYHDKNGEIYRVYDALKVETIQGYPTVTQSRMKDLKAQGETTLEYGDVTYDIGLPEDIFTERYLRLPPKEYLR